MKRVLNCADTKTWPIVTHLQNLNVFDVSVCVCERALRYMACGVPVCPLALFCVRACASCGGVLNARNLAARWSFFVLNC